ncbi:GAF domain-containing protein [Henriciella aquimarina]|uniref:GAF domain-containing protein n=1 Tax=Henriciella aquimarina TaxID=545261 RepID=UPI001F294FC9|nr:GAF domain-containing protein [Henriciella aquimarina]
MVKVYKDEREAARLQCLRRMRILDTAAEECFDSITRSTARHFNVPIALVSLVDEKRQWFKSRVGLDACETDRRHSFCAHAIGLEQVMVVEDATRDPRFAENPLVTGAPFIRFYAGAPLKIAGEALSIGTLCVIDTQPRAFDAEQRGELLKMSRLVTRQLDRYPRRSTPPSAPGLQEGGPE